MIEIANAEIALRCNEDGTVLQLEDRRRNADWRLDYASLTYSREAYRKNRPLPRIDGLLKPETASRSGDALAVTFDAGGDKLRYTYKLEGDGIEVTLSANGVSSVLGAPLPGQFLPDEGKTEYLLPIMQGMLWRGGGAPFRWQINDGAHRGYSMAMLGYLGGRGGLLCAPDTRDDATLAVSKSDDGACSAQFLQVSSLGSLRYDRVAHLVPTDRDIVAVAKAYRKRIKARGLFHSWDEKIAARPELQGLFGSLMCFIGYCQDDIDYPRELAKLKAYGFDRALVYPARFDNYDQPLVMGGRDPINLSPDDVAAIKALGYNVAPWSWVNEAMDDGKPSVEAMFRRDAKGERIPHWRIDDQEWFFVCSSFMADYKRKKNSTVLADMRWDHFDVVTCNANDECHALDHPGHLGRPISRGEDKAFLQDLLEAGEANGSRPVSSESFNDAFDYDLGSVKAFPMFRHWPLWPVPLTSLVYHDSMIHSHWEVHNYNFPKFNRYVAGMFEYGGGRPTLQAAQDALTGSPPDVFPVGAQYQWTGRGSETSLFKFRFEDPEVQIALRHALPVAKLHREIGKLEMTDFKILTDDGNVQRSVFSDGTTIVANFGIDLRRDVDGLESIGGESWVRLA